MTQPKPVIDESTLEVPNPRPYLLGGIAGVAIIATVVTKLFQSQSNATAVGAAVGVASGLCAPRVWTTAFSENDTFLGQIKNLAPQTVTL